MAPKGKRAAPAPAFDPIAYEQQIRQRAAQQYERQVLPDFTEATFIATVGGYRGNRGELELSLLVAPGEKYNAIPVTDAQGYQVIVNIRRLRRADGRTDTPAADPPTPKRARGRR